MRLPLGPKIGCEILIDRESTLACVDRIKGPIQDYTRTWMLSDATNAYGVRLGFTSGVQFWIVGRAGVLGNCPPEVASAAIAFEPLDIVSKAWGAVPDNLTHYEVALHYAGRVIDWGEGAFAKKDPDVLEAINVLGRHVVDAAPAAIGVLFAGWRQLGPPQTQAGRAALVLHLLRELRGAAHIAAVIACGLTPVDAIIAAPHPPPRTGHTYAEKMGHRGPFRNPEEVRQQRMEAERLTSALLVPHFNSLSAADLTTLGDAIETCCALTR
ncbi:helix-turn-helix domain-containing protein [Mycolicibacterium komossense]|uniref:Uncharacterized protein n=1 Tax=Mycolicibacterium komossense TaxID=1779 RepID=A0ABT3C703_9MYCO|nr:hypothetical protein [Mycolicibacterium komossense]MCV7225254.1 hypothetical protein [Mycolicibacterium komossense]